MTAYMVPIPTIPPTIETIASIHDANPGGDIFGGWIMGQMDLSGGSRAFAYAGGRVVTAGVTELAFLKPTYVGDVLRFYTMIERVGRTSIGIRIDVWRQNAAAPDFDLVGTGLFTFVHVDANSKPVELKQPQEAA